MPVDTVQTHYLLPFLSFNYDYHINIMNYETVVDTVVTLCPVNSKWSFYDPATNRTSSRNLSIVELYLSLDAIERCFGVISMHFTCGLSRLGEVWWPLLHLLLCRRTSLCLRLIMFCLVKKPEWAKLHGSEGMGGALIVYIFSLLSAHCPW